MVNSVPVMMFTRRVEIRIHLQGDPAGSVFQKIVIKSRKIKTNYDIGFSKSRKFDRKRLAFCNLVFDIFGTL